MKKIAVKSIVVAIACLYATSAMAIVLDSISKEMCSGSSACDRAGDIQIFFSEQDVEDIQGLTNSNPATTGVQNNFSFIDSNPDTITRIAGDFTADGFEIGDSIEIIGSAGNDGQYYSTIDAVTPLTLMLSHDVSPEAPGADVTITTYETTEYVLLRFTLSGTNLDPTKGPPILCAHIAGDPANDLVFTNPVANWNDVVDLEEINVEVSDKSGNTTADVTAYVAGTSGNQYFEVVITGIETGEASSSADYNDWPWVRVGLDPGDTSVTIADNESHAIWVNVPAFKLNSTLEASLDTWPNILTYTPGNDQIGHFTTDSDGDGTLNCHDGCPNDPAKIDPGICGCGIPDIDNDGDGIFDCMDGCPSDLFKIEPGVCGCGVSDTDSDNDGTPDCNDGCPDDPDKTEPGAYGCGISDVDTDGDGTPDDNDNCPNDPAKIDAGICGCGVSDIDTDNDGTPDCNDDTPNGVWDDYDDDDADFCDFIPIAVLPVDGVIDTLLTPTFVIDYDIDPDICGDHHKTRWQISERLNFNGLTYNKNIIQKDPFSHEVAPGVLEPNTTYYWRARVWCSQGCKSRYSEAVSFTTGPDPNYDGQPGNQGNHSRGVYAVVGNQYVYIETSENITFLQALDNQDQDILDGMPDNMPWGLINFRIEIAAPGDTVQVTINFEEKAPNGSVFYKYDVAEGWIDYSDHATFAPDMKSVTIEIKDGGFGDLDGTVNGVIVDPCGIGTFASGGGGGGGGCFLDIASSATSR